MRHALHLDRGHRAPRYGGEDDAAQGVAERVAVARIQSVYLVDAGRPLFGDDAGLGGKGYRIVHDSIVSILINKISACSTRRPRQYPPWIPAPTVPESQRGCPPSCRHRTRPMTGRGIP